MSMKFILRYFLEDFQGYFASNFPFYIMDFNIGQVGGRTLNDRQVLGLKAV